MSELVQFAYTVTPSPDLGEDCFRSSLVRDVFPKAKILRRDVTATRNDFVTLPSANGHGGDHLWLVGLEVMSLPARAPDPARLAESLGALGTVEPWSGPFVSVDVDLDRNRAVIQPNSLTVPKGERLIWSFHGVPRHYQPHVDVFGFQAPGADLVNDDFEPPFEELAARKSLIRSGRVTGPEGHYWYEVALVPGRRGPDDKVIRLECDPWSKGQPEGRRAAAVEITEPPIRPAG